MPIQATNYDATKEYNLAEMIDLMNDNLLLNSDFASGIINQKGQTIYSANGIYTIDLWRLVGSGRFGGKVTVGTNDVLIENNGTNDLFFVNKTDLSSLIDGDYLIYVNVTGLGNSTAYVYCDAESGKVGRTQLTQGENFIPIKGKPVTIGFELSSTTRLRINKVKLEKGSRFTGMKPWNEAEELFKCQSISQIYTDVICPAVKVGSKLIVTIPLYTKLIEKPSVTMSGSINVFTPSGQKTGTVSSVGYVTQDKNSLRCEITTSNLADIPQQQPLIVQIANVKIDANTY